MTPTATQICDYVRKIYVFPQQAGLPRITQARIGEILSVAGSTVSSFLDNPGKNKLYRNFVQKFPQETADKIERALVKADVFAFFNLPQPALGESETPLRIPIPVLSPLPILRDTRPDNVADLDEDMEAEANSFAVNKMGQAPLVISYRGHKSGKDGAGMLFDHMSYQLATGHATQIGVPESVRRAVEGLFDSAVGQNTAQLPHRNPVVSEEGGLLIIPGRVHATENEPVRMAYENNLIKWALLRGQPIIGICAGAWRVWEGAVTVFSQSNHGIAPCIDVADHNYGGGMIRLGTTGMYAVCNVQIHNVKVKENSLLAQAMGRAGGMPVNSVHWKAVNAAVMPPNFRISARATRNPAIQLNTRQGTPMEPQEKTPEAFEPLFGVPIFGIQWHPEGYTNFLNPRAKGLPAHSEAHIELLTYMAKAGDAYAAKRRMLAELTKRS